MRPVHFYLTFNPYLNKHDVGVTQAHEFFDYLKSELKKNPEGYAWWGKMISKDRESKVDVNKVFEVIKTNQENEHSTHLYITDFNNLWVTKVTGVSSGIGNDFKTLDFYKDKKVEVWFKITDMTLLSFSPEETAQKLSQLYIDNEYNDLKIEGLSPFTTGVRYPAFIQDSSAESFFDENTDEGPLIYKYNPAMYQEGAKKVLDCLHSYVFPEAIYKRIPHAAKTEIEHSELDVLEKRTHSIKRNALSYIKALEIILNDLTIGHIKRSGHGNNFYVQPETMPPKLYLDQKRPGLVSINKWHKNYSMNQLFYFMQRCVETNNFCFKKAFQGRQNFVNFMINELIPLLKEYKIVEMRGILAHNDSNNINESDALAIRNIILGIGRTGLIHKAMQSFYSKELGELNKIKGEYKKVDFKKFKKSS